MSTHKPITIVGGGLAGLTLGIGLRQRDVPVTVLEAGAYPRHKVCGEFVSGRGRDVLRRLELEPKLVAAGARTGASVEFFADTLRAGQRRLPDEALCLSRHAMDSVLAEDFKRRGGELVTGRRSTGDLGEGFVRATGRRPQAQEEGWRYFGLKAHVRGVALESDLEMHLTTAGYVGLCRIEGDEVNVCGLFRSREPVQSLARDWKDWLQGAPGSHLSRRLAGAAWDEASACTVAGLSLAPRSAATLPECAVGDSLTMIPPVTGNGMSMAFESAENAVAPLTEYSRGERAWEETMKAVAVANDGAFSGRLRWASRLQRGLMSPRWSVVLFDTVRKCPKALDVFFRLTR